VSRSREYCFFTFARPTPDVVLAYETDVACGVALTHVDEASRR
jgi:hypothetical protein